MESSSAPVTPAPLGSFNSNNINTMSSLSSTLPSISQPKAGGAVRGLDEKLGVNGTSGTATASVVFPASTSRSGFGPELSLSYDSGASNGILGLGWHLTMPEIGRRTDKGLPRYDDTHESDMFTLVGLEDLVPVLKPSTVDSQVVWQAVQEKRWLPGTDRSFRVHQYRPRSEGSFSAIERWTDCTNGESHWRTVSGNNVVTLFGVDRGSRIYNPQDPRKIFKWLASYTYDDRGNAISFEYKSEDSKNITLDHVYEGSVTTPVRSTQRYPKRIKYGNRTPYSPLQSDIHTMQWMFEVVFDYGEHGWNSPSARPVTAWDCRPDPLSDRRPGFEVRSYRRCRRILMFHHFPDEPGIGNDYAVLSLDIDYHSMPRLTSAVSLQNNPVFLSSCISSMAQRSYLRDDEMKYQSKSLPPVEYEYTMADLSPKIGDLDSETAAQFPGGIDGTNSMFLDLDGEGIPGVLSTYQASLYYSSNRGDGKFDPPRQLPFEPSLATNSALQWMDLAGSGQLDMVMMTGPVKGFAESDPKNTNTFADFQPFKSTPNIDMSDPNLRFVDLTCDGRADILVMDNEHITWYPSLGKDGFGPARTIFTPLDENAGARLLFSTQSDTVHLSDMTGDGLIDLVRVRNGDICYWPNLGYGSFGPKVTMGNSPFFDKPELFQPDRVFLADIDGTGTTDIIYLNGSEAQYYLNLAGNCWSSAITVDFPLVNPLTKIHIVDLFGRGTSCLVWSSSSPASNQRQIRYIDLAPVKPYMLRCVKNNLGGETSFTYASSTKFYLDDKHAGRQWVTRLPFPVQVVECKESMDKISGNRFFNRYAYHHGFYDGVEREFRGFGMVEQWDTESLALLQDHDNPPSGTNYDSISDIPPIHTKTWIHTGAWREEDDQIQARFQHEYWEDPYRDNIKEPGQLHRNIFPNSIKAGSFDMPHDLSPSEARQAARSLKGSVLHSEMYALDGTEAQSRPYSVSHSAYTIDMLQPQWPSRYAVFLTHLRESVTYDYERHVYTTINGKKTTDPRVSHSMTLRIDRFGNVLESAAINYGRRHRDPNTILTDDDAAKQHHTYVSCSEIQYTNSIILPDTRRLPVTARAKSYELHNLVPDSIHPRDWCLFTIQQLRQAISLVSDGARDLAYENFQGKSNQEGPRRRLLTDSFILYRQDSLEGPLKLGQLESLGLPYQTFTLAFNQTELNRAFVEPGKLTAHDLDHIMETEGGYHKMDNRWWIPSGVTFFAPATEPDQLSFARCHFFIPRRSRTPFGAETVAEMDRYDLLVKQTTDPFGNRTTVGQRPDPARGIPAISGLDYRVLSPYMIQDANGNRAMSAFDIHGQIVGKATMGKPEENLGDNLEGFVKDLSEKEIRGYFANPKSAADHLLGNASSRFAYDYFAYYRSRHKPNPEPTAVSTITRETHVSDLESNTSSRVTVRVAYSDGMGRVLQEKIEAEPGPVSSLPHLRRARRHNPSCQYAREDEQFYEQRWITSGWTAYNNKGMAVRVYEPFFSTTHEYERDNKLGISPITFFDPKGRSIGILSPDHTWSKVIFDSWTGEVWDKNDTVLLNPEDDADVGDYFKRLPRRDFLPTWYEQRTNPSSPRRDRIAALKSAAHANTPGLSFADSLGRPILTVQQVKTPGSHDPSSITRIFSRKVLDIEGKEHEMRDSKGRLVIVNLFGQAGQPLYSRNMDSGERWLLSDIHGLPIRKWDNRHQQFRMTYDILRRVDAVFLTPDTGENSSNQIMISRTVHGDSLLNPEKTNLRGRVAELHDQSGISSTKDYDFKGNLLTATRRLALEFRKEIDVSGQVDLEPEIYTNHVSYDALGRQTSMTLPNGERTRYKYNVSGGIEQVWGKLSEHASETVYLEHVEYDAKGQQVSATYGNGVRTKARYDLLTFRLVNTRTVGFKKHKRRTGSRERSKSNSSNSSGGRSTPSRRSSRLSERRRRLVTYLDITYAYDAVGNIVHCVDEQQDTLYFRGKVVSPDQEFTYDSLYRLVESKGREHLGQKGGGGSGEWERNEVGGGDASQVRLDHGHNGHAMTRYTQKYQYDSENNLEWMKHESSESSRSWTRHYDYKEPSLLEPNKVNNRLSETRIGNNRLGRFRYDGVEGKHGNMSSLPSIPELSWNPKDQLRSTCRRSGLVSWYVYDDSGKRTRKITEQHDKEGLEPPRKVKETFYIGGSYEIFRTYSGQQENSTQAVSLEIETVAVSSGGDRVAMAENRLQGGSNGRVPSQLIRYQHANVQNSVTLELDDEANVVSYEEFTAYGTTSYEAVGDRTDIPKRYRYTGKEKDSETGLYHMGVRYYMAGVARWTSADPKGIADGFNIFAYARANPVAFTDPSGTGGDDPGSGKRQPVVYSYGDAFGYVKNGVTPDVTRSLGSEVTQSHVMSVDIWKWLTGGTYTRGVSATGKLNVGGTVVDLGGRENIILTPPGLEEKISQHMVPVIESVKSGSIDNIDEYLAQTKTAWKAAYAEYDQFVQANPGKGKPAGDFPEDTFDLVGMYTKDRMTKAEAAQSGWKGIAAAKAAAASGGGGGGGPSPPSGGGTPPPTPPSGPPDDEPPPSSGGGSTPPPAAPAAPPAAPPPTTPPALPPSSGASGKASLMSRVGSSLRNTSSRIASGSRTATTYGKALAGAALESGARLMLPFYAEYAQMAETNVPTFLALGVGAPAAVVKAAAAIEAAPLATYVGLVAAPAVAGAVVGGLASEGVKALGGTKNEGRMAGVVAGAVVGAAIGVWFGGVGAPVGAVIGGAVGGIAGLWAAW
ncbi:virulence plasmid 65kDa B protein-domain-containing protein [Rhypophila decipiens]|uniref:Virulence plasmid 65kDa B protein-domain-containing protein n=1 Tax=Rhypophila decipiens TaxID=261697 RepID=A0AAN7B1N9_9PEZI|nr:virulence plasmid 65kDa B protein-domain-containing protein [Rhypophila decipiens]